MEQGKRLAYLMDALEISGKEMAEALGIDKTMISKWRKGHRRLAYKSRYMQPVSSYLLSAAMEQRRELIAKLLPEQADALQGGDAETVAHALSLWLSEAPQNEAASPAAPAYMDYPVLTEAYNGLHSWKPAVAAFYQEALHVAAGKTITILDFGQVNWAEDNESNVRLMVGYIQEALKNGNNVCIIDKIAQEYRPWEIVFRWLPIYLSKNVEIRYCQNAENLIAQQNLYFAPNRAALLCSSIANLPDEDHCILSREPATVRFYDAVIQYVRSNSRRLFETVDASDTMWILEQIDGKLKRGPLTYMVNAMPTFRNMPTSLLRAILEDNHVDEVTTERCIAANERSRTTRKRRQCRQIYNLDYLEHALQQEYSMAYELTAVVGTPVRLRRKFLLEQLAYLRNHCNEEHYTITLASFSALELQQPTISLIVQDDSLAVAWDPQRFTRRIFCTELTAVGGFFRYMEMLWDKIPPICKSESWTCKQFDQLLQSKD